MSEGESAVSSECSKRLQGRRRFAIEWDEEIEEAYRFHIAGYRDEHHYKTAQRVYKVERWPSNDFVKKLQRTDGNFFYYDETRECPDHEVGRVKARIRTYDIHKSTAPLYSPPRTRSPSPKKKRHSSRSRSRSHSRKPGRRRPPKPPKVSRTVQTEESAEYPRLRRLQPVCSHWMEFLVMQNAIEEGYAMMSPRREEESFLAGDDVGTARKGSLKVPSSALKRPASSEKPKSGKKVNFKLNFPHK